MARTKLEIDRNEFQKVVSALEASQTFVNPSALWKAVENSEWAKSQKPRPLTAAVAYARAKELGISSITKPGKKGGGNPNLGLLPRGPRVKRCDKFKKFTKEFEQMRKQTPEAYAGLVDRLEAGSSKAAFKLKCLECSNYNTKEVRHCAVKTCALYPFRPFQEKDETEVSDNAE